MSLRLQLLTLYAAAVAAHALLVFGLARGPLAWSIFLPLLLLDAGAVYLPARLL